MIRRIIYVVIIAIGILEMIWGMLWGPLGINDVAGGPNGDRSRTARWNSSVVHLYSVY